MTEERFDLSRRKALAALGTIGVASAGAGLGTSAYFSDQETFDNNRLVAGTLDLQVAVSQHYVDWLPDTETGGNVSPPAPQETDDAEMATGEPDIRLGPGAAGRGATRAEPIELDLVDDDDESDDDGTGDENALEFAVGSLVNRINGGVPPGERESLCTLDGDFDDDDAERPILHLEDVKPGDFGFVRFEFASCDNPAFVRISGTLESSAENGTTEPEADDEDEVAGEVELLDEVQLAILPDDVYQILAAGNTADVSSGQGFAGDVPVTLGTLLREGGQGADADPVVEPLDGDIPPEEGGGTGDRNCFSGETNHRRTLVWWLPIDHANEIQTDSATFSLGLYAEQCRHNDGSGMNDDQVDGQDALVIDDQTANAPP
jgi:predicted ribosomally synthesized peptide with SipW-like signal peptide